MSLKEAFADGANKLSGEYRGFFLAVSRELAQNTEKTFAQIFAECGEQYLGRLELTREEQEEFLILGSRLGYLDVEMQCRQLELYEAHSGSAGTDSCKKESVSESWTAWRASGSSAGLVEGMKGGDLGGQYYF